MKKSTHILPVAMLAVLFSTGVQAQPGTGKGNDKKTVATPAANPPAKGVLTVETNAAEKKASGTLTASATTGGSTTVGSTTATTSASLGKGKGQSNAKGPNENASDNAKAVHDVIEKFQVQRKDYLAERKALLEKLKTATEMERKAIIEQLREDKKAREDEERALAKQIREELKSLRAERKGGGN